MHKPGEISDLALNYRRDEQEELCSKLLIDNMNLKFTSFTVRWNRFLVLYTRSGCDGYAFVINKTNNNLVSYSWMFPKAIGDIYEDWCTTVQSNTFTFTQASEHKARSLKLKITPTRGVHYVLNWVTNLPLPCAARAMWFRKDKEEKSSVRGVSAWVSGVDKGLVCRFRPHDGTDGGNYEPCTAAFGNQWQRMRMVQSCSVLKAAWAADQSRH